MKKLKTLKRIVEKILFNSKWILVPFYMGLILAQIVYLFWFTKDLYYLLIEANSMTKESAMLIVLELVDVVMIANLLKMIISGSYTSFITADHNEKSEKSSSGLLKVKMAASLIGVSSIHLLQSFINAIQINWETIQKQLVIHAGFLLGALVLMIIEYIHVKAEALHLQSEASHLEHTRSKHSLNDENINK